MNIEQYVTEKAMIAKQASRKMATIDTNTKNKALLAMGQALIDRKGEIFSSNKLDMDNGIKNGLSKSLLDRLLITEARIKDMSLGLNEVANLDDPIGESIRMWKRPNDLKINQVRVPLGVIGIIYEARPNVTVDASALCLKSGNTVILKGGKEAINSNIKIAEILEEEAIKSGLPKGCINFIEQTDREAVNVLMKLNKYVDVLIPRGGAGLINAVVNNSTIPVIETGVGNCHIFVDKTAYLENAVDIIINAKTQRPAVCNAIETVLIHKEIAEKFLPMLIPSLKELGVEIRGCNQTLKYISSINKATEEDWSTEYLDLILSIKIVEGIDEAIDHIYKYSTKHSESILTNDHRNAEKFLAEIDSAAVYINASTRFTDGSEFGFGAEIGISTQKLHARGPMGLKELTSTKYLINGNGQIR
ncbi:glutamate-5-semialdehyde dehydrogenase [Clostridium sp. DL1XJH146]